MDFKEELTEILIRMGLKNPVLELNVRSEGKISGFVISESFTGKSQTELQDMLRHLG